MKFTEQQKTAVVQNLKDAGCEEPFIRRFLKLKEEDRHEEAMQLLAEQRCRLLCQMHEAQKPLDCLDYFIYQLKKQKESFVNHKR